VTTGAVGSNARRQTWSDIRGSLNLLCGSQFSN